MNGWVWLISEYGGDAHAFDPIAFEGKPYLEAQCEHTAPRNKLHPFVQGKPLCVACLLAVGNQIPEGTTWPSR